MTCPYFLLQGPFSGENATKGCSALLLPLGSLLTLKSSTRWSNLPKTEALQNSFLWVARLLESFKLETLQLLHCKQHLVFWKNKVQLGTRPISANLLLEQYLHIFSGTFVLAASVQQVWNTVPQKSHFSPYYSFFSWLPSEKEVERSMTLKESQAKVV